MTKNIRRFELKLGRIGLVLFVLGLSGLLFGVFLLGVMVGKNIDTYPEKMARFVPDRIKILMSRMSRNAEQPVAVVRDDAAQEKPEPDMDLSYHERLSKRGRGQNGSSLDGVMLQKQPPASAGEAPSLPRQAIQSAESKKAAPVTAAPAAPPVQEKPAKQQAFMVQVVSYQDESKAEALVKKIAALGYAARTDVTELPEKGTWFRVVMGEFASRAEAQQAIDVISKKTKGLNCVIRPVEGGGN